MSVRSSNRTTGIDRPHRPAAVIGIEQCSSLSPQDTHLEQLQGREALDQHRMADRAPSVEREKTARCSLRSLVRAGAGSSDRSPTGQVALESELDRSFHGGFEEVGDLIARASIPTASMGTDPAHLSMNPEPPSRQRFRPTYEFAPVR